MTENTSYEIPATPVDQLSFEEALQELENIASLLESNALPLETALAAFERGQALAQRCTTLLDKAELRVKQLAGEDLIDFTPS
jgi:exodeoxyribonuclease VII small subunit